MKIALVVPSIREEQMVEFLAAWQDQLKIAEVTTYLVEDNAEKSFTFNSPDYYQFNHLCWRDAPQAVLDCINVKSPGCRQIGFWKAYHDGCDLVVTLDDDVRPVEGGSNAFLKFAEILGLGIPLWVDPLINYRSRGYPEKNVGNLKVHFHVASFLNIPDVDGDTQLKHEKDFSTNPPLYLPRPTLVPHKQLIPINGGVFGFRKEMIPYIHYTLWCPELKFWRFDDIWMGVILKKWIDLCDLRISYGPPFVDHIRASDAVQNQKREKEGKKWNEVFWQHLDEAVDRRVEHRPAGLDEAFDLIAACLVEMDNLWARREGKSMKAWRKLFPARE